MIRIIVDPLSDGHLDIFLKVDSLPNFIGVSDSYYLHDFFTLSNQLSEVDVFSTLINYLQSEFSNIGSDEKFIAFDLSDEYVGGFLVSQGKKGLTKVIYAVTTDLSGHEVTIAHLVDLIRERNPVFEPEREWLLSTSAIQQGLNWSFELYKKMNQWTSTNTN